MDPAAHGPGLWTGWTMVGLDLGTPSSLTIVLFGPRYGHRNTLTMDFPLDRGIKVDIGIPRPMVLRLR